MLSAGCGSISVLASINSVFIMYQVAMIAADLHWGKRTIAEPLTAIVVHLVLLLVSIALIKRLAMRDAFG